jgi:hypothetical protein
MSEQKVLFEIVLENGDFKVKAKEASDGLENIGNKATKSEGAFSKLKSSWIATTAAAVGVIYAFTKVGQALGECIEYASKLQETQNKFDVVFKKSKDQANAFAKTLVESYGLAKEEAMSFLAGTGDILTGLGMQSDKALELSNSVAQLGIDLASFSNVEGGSERAIAALTSALTGEREALKAYGIVVSEEMIKEKLVAENKSKLTGLALNQAKAEATLAIAYSQSANSVGDMARSFDSYANIQRRIDSRIVDMEAGIGQGLIPSMSNLGLAFLSASKDGGIFTRALGGITKYIAGVINGLAVLTVRLNAWGAASRTEEAQDTFKAEMANYKMRLKAQQDLRFGQLSFNEAVKAGIPEAVRVADETEKARLRAIAKAKTAVEAGQAEKDALNDVMKIQKRIEDEQKGIDQAIKDREKEKKKDPTTNSVGGGGGKPKAEKPAEEFDPEKYGLTGASLLSSYNSEISQLYAMDVANQNAAVDNKLRKQLTAIEEVYNAEKAAIENSLLSREEKDAKLKTLDEKRAREEKSATDKAEKEKRKIARESAEMQKKLAIADVLINTPAAALQTFRAIVQPGMPWTVPLAYAAAIGTTALGMAKLKLIKEQPLPSYAVGTWAVPQDQTAQIHKGEMIIPKTFSDSVRKGEATIGGGSTIININVSGSIIDKDGFAQSVNEALMDVQRRTGVNIYSRKSVY